VVNLSLPGEKKTENSTDAREKLEGRTFSSFISMDSLKKRNRAKEDKKRPRGVYVWGRVRSEVADLAKGDSISLRRDIRKSLY